MSSNLSSHLDGSETHLEGGQPTTAWNVIVIQAFAYYLMILLSLIGNTVVIKAIKRTGKTLRRQVHYIFIVNLSVADLLFALENIPMVCTHLLLNGAWKIEGNVGTFLCRFDLFLSIILILVSNLTILAIAFEKFCGIFFPMKTFVSRKRSYVIVGSTWLIGALYASPLFSSGFAKLKNYPDGNYRCELCITCKKVVNWFILQSAVLATGFVITLTLYLAIGMKIWLRKTPGFQFREFQRRAEVKKHRAIKMLAMLVFVFYISFIPFWIYQLSIYLSFHKILGPKYGQISAFLMYCNGAINPLIYSVYNLDIRGEFKALLTCKKPTERPRSLMTIQTRRQTETTAELTVKNKVCPCYKTNQEVTGMKNEGFICEDTRL